MPPEVICDALAPKLASAITDAAAIVFNKFIEFPYRYSKFFIILHVLSIFYAKPKTFTISLINHKLNYLLPYTAIKQVTNL